MAEVLINQVSQELSRLLKEIPLPKGRERFILRAGEIGFALLILTVPVIMGAGLAMTLTTNPAVEKLAAETIIGSSLMTIVGSGMGFLGMHVRNHIEHRRLSALLEKLQ